MTIKILGKTYQLVETREDMTGGSIMGAANRQKQVITILSEGVGEEQRQDTLLHEVVHIIDIELALGLSEENVARMACGLYSAGLRVKVDK
jgi:hypothetical protein